MAVNVETLEKLERKITLTLPVETIQNEVDARLRKLARTVKMANSMTGTPPAIEAEPLLLSSTAPATSMR